MSGVLQSILQKKCSGPNTCKAPLLPNVLQSQNTRHQRAALLSSFRGSLLNPCHRHTRLPSGKYSFPNNGFSMNQQSTQTLSNNSKTVRMLLISSNAEAGNVIGGTITPSHLTAWSNATLGRAACAKCGALSEVRAPHRAPRLCVDH